jgi:hypothetical protein
MLLNYIFIMLLKFLVLSIACLLCYILLLRPSLWRLWLVGVMFGYYKCLGRFCCFCKALCWFSCMMSCDICSHRSRKFRCFACIIMSSFVNWLADSILVLCVEVVLANVYVLLYSIMLIQLIVSCLLYWLALFKMCSNLWRPRGRRSVRSTSRWGSMLSRPRLGANVLLV